MRIITPEDIEAVAWEGALEPSGDVPVRGQITTPRITLGEPTSWTPDQAMQGELGKSWTPPSGDRRYLLLRLACSLHPLTEDRARYDEARLAVYLRPRSGAGSAFAHDLFPQRVGAERKGKFTVSLGPDLKFGPVVDLSLGQAGAEIEYLQVFPAIQAYGLGESNPYWRFAHHASLPLFGCQHVYLVTALPRDAGGVRLAMELTATVETRYGPIRVGLPAEARAHLTRTIEA
jgi:hypothetical protein